MVRVVKVVKDDFTVDASQVDDVFIYYKCSFCKKSHKHGSSGDFSQRTETRVSHCNIHRGTVFIRVCDKTKGALPSVNIVSSKPEVNKKYLTIMDMMEICKRNNMSFDEVMAEYDEKSIQLDEEFSTVYVKRAPKRYSIFS